MKLSVIIPCYNCAATLPAQLRALSENPPPDDWEVIVADNGSTDDVGSVIDAFEARIPVLKLVDASGVRGASHARNVGCEHASGDVFVFCDADDEVSPGWLGTMYRALEQYEFVTGPVEYQKLNEAAGTPTRRRTSLRTSAYLPHLPFGISGNMGVRREVHFRVGGFDPELRAAEDLDYSWRVQMSGVELHFLPDAVIHYRLRESLKGMFFQHMRYGEQEVKVYKKFLGCGYPKRRLKDALKDWVRLLRDARWLANAASRPRWMRRFGNLIGRLKGSIRHRVMAA